MTFHWKNCPVQHDIVQCNNISKGYPRLLYFSSVKLPWLRWSYFCCWIRCWTLLTRSEHTCFSSLISLLNSTISSLIYNIHKNSISIYRMSVGLAQLMFVCLFDWGLTSNSRVFHFIWWRIVHLTMYLE